VNGFQFRPLQRNDFALLSRWLAAPHVARWWDDDPSPAALEADYGGCIDGTEPCQAFFACGDGAPLGFVQRYLWHAYPAYVAELAPILAAPAAACSIDYFIGPVAALGRGLGARMISPFAREVWRDGAMNASCILVPTHADNRASWRTLERVGFQRVAEGELTPDNPVDDRRHFIYRLARPV
jgi:aminoglycoside 6'-N-acetyltransferase